MSRLVLRPLWMAAVDARELADACIRGWEDKGDAEIEKVEVLLGRAESSSRYLTPTTISPTIYQQFWRLRFFTQTLELSTVRVIEHLLLALKCQFVDVGAHAGYFSILAAECRSPRIVGVEMHSVNQQLYRANVPNALLVCGAAGSRRSRRDYFVGTGHSNHSLVSRGDTTDDRSSTEVFSLDEILGSPSPSLSLVKIDVQGSEADVLAGFELGLKSGRALLVLEIERLESCDRIDRVYKEAMTMLMAYDYDIFSIQEQQLIQLIGPDDPALDDLPASSNVLAVPKALAAATFEALYRRDV